MQTSRTTAMERARASSNDNSSTPAVHTGLTPSQVTTKGKPEAKPTPGEAMNGNTEGRPAEASGNRKRRNRRRKGKKAAQQQDNNATDVVENKLMVPEVATKTQPPNQTRGKAKGKQEQQNIQNAGNAQSNRPQGKKGRNRKPRKRYPWRRFIPPGTVDPITLENLNSLLYPPFALVATGPYVPVPVWPVPERGDVPEEKTEDAEDINRRRLQEQWGSVMIASDDNDTTPAPADSGEKRYYNLFDGRALAYYLVSQLQFIDPLNRRDLTRDELLNLDAYLRRHGFKDLRVTEAYDAKGVTLSSAGAAASTAQGRADILQQMARNLLNSLFGGNSVGGGNEAPVGEASGRTALQEQYDAMRLQEEQDRARNTGGRRGLNPNAAPFGGFGVQPADDGGLMVIDDDENPGLRGGNYSAAPGSVRSGAFYSAAHITGRYGSGTAPSTPDAFPALQAPTAPPASAPASAQTEASTAKPAAKPSKTLARIAGAVKKTDPEEQQRQWEARELARKKAMLSKLTFGVDAAAPQAMDSLPRPPQPLAGGATQPAFREGMLQRNRALADALGVKPATVRQQINSGWARPTDGAQPTNLDEFGNELTAPSYPNSLISEAKERMGLVLKLEKKWKNFLSDDTAASMPLNPMDKPTRIFVHHYSDFWNLRTESFDPEPRRYIHCVKMLDTRMPAPLLSAEARNWRGPALQLPTAPKSDHATHQTAGQTTKSREAPADTESLVLAPRSLPPPSAEDPESRFGALSSQRERPKLELAKRSVPLELPPYQPEPKFDLAADMKQSKAKKEEKERKKREADEHKRRALESAFASDSEEESLAADSGSEWEESEPLYVGNDEE